MESGQLSIHTYIHRNTRLALFFALQFTLRQNLLMLLLDPVFHHCLPQIKTFLSFLRLTDQQVLVTLKVAVRHLNLSWGLMKVEITS